MLRNPSSVFGSSQYTQRAVATEIGSNTHCTPYSSARRKATTSNCSCPTAPRIRSLLRSGRNSWVAPSSHSWSSPFCSAFMRNGSFSTARLKISGAKLGMPVNISDSPSVKVSPMLIVPWLCSPMMSPA